MSEHDGRSPSRGSLAAACVALALAVALAFSPARANGFVAYDDDVYLLDNPIVAEGLTAAAFRGAFTSTRTGNWHPLTWLSHALDVELFGFDPGKHHAVSIALHALSACLLLLLLARTTGRLAPAFFAAALFALHPLRVESVAWAAERKDVLSVCFGLAALLAYAGWARAGGRWRYALALGLYALALMSKSMLVTLPVLLVLLDLWPLRRGFHLRDKLPFAGLAAVTLAVAFATQHGEGATATLRLFPLSTRVANAFAAGAHYVADTLFPVDLVVFHPHPAVFGSVPVAWVLAGVLLLTVGAWLAFRTRARAPWVGVGLAWFVVTLVPVIGLVQVGMQGRADRYTYLPSIGLFVALVYGLEDWSRERPGVRRGLLGAGMLVIVYLPILTARQTRLWHDTVSLFEHTRAHTTHNWVALRAIGNAYAEQGELERAVEALSEEAELGLGDPELEARLGELLFRLGRLDEARAHYERAIALAPGDGDLSLDLANALLGAGEVDAAEAALENARAKGAAPARLAYTGGLLAAAHQDGEAAMTAYAEAVRLDPSFADAWNNLGSTYLALGRGEDALAAFQRLVALEPESAEAAFNLGAAHENLGHKEDAIAAFRRAAELAGPSTPLGGQASLRAGVLSGLVGPGDIY